jgi:hypothetical protein
MSDRYVKLVDGVEVEMTPEEISAFQASRVHASTPTNADVDAEHDRRALVGKTFAIAGYGSVALEGSLRTQAVLLALKDTARDLLEASVTDPVLMITDRDNTDHNLTPAQVIELVNAGKTYMQSLHEAKRSLKTTNPIPADYSDDAYWPE